MGMVTDHHIRAGLDGGLGKFALRGSGSVAQLFAPVEGGDENIAFLAQLRDHFAHLAGLIIPFGEADQADFYALDLHHLRLRIAIGHDAHGLHRGEGILITLFLKIARVVVGHVHGFHAGGGKDLRVARIAPEIELAAPALIVRSGQRPFQVDDGQIIRLKDGLEVGQEIVVSIFFHKRLEARVVLVHIARQRAIAAKGDGDLLRLGHGRGRGRRRGGRLGRRRQNRRGRRGGFGREFGREHLGARLAGHSLVHHAAHGPQQHRKQNKRRHTHALERAPRALFPSPTLCHANLLPFRLFPL